MSQSKRSVSDNPPAGRATGRKRSAHADILPPQLGALGRSSPQGRLLQAAYEGDGARMESLLSEGVQADTRDERGRSALMLACMRLNGDAVSTLLRFGADPSAKDEDGLTASDHLERSRESLVDAFDKGDEGTALAFVRSMDQSSRISSPSNPTSKDAGHMQAILGILSCESDRFVKGFVAVGKIRELLEGKRAEVGSRDP